ncbi:MAG: peroxide stress protein YaaA [Chitinophagales bacterium]
MIAILSPAKKLDMDSAINYPESTKPAFLKDAEELMTVLKEMSSPDLSKLMHISENLGDLNYERNQTWKKSHTEKNARPAIFSFKGDAYLGFGVEDFTAEELLKAQDKIRILSGLYGLLRPLDLMKAYRLEMGSRMKNPRGKNLYDFWGSQITKALNKEIAKNGGVLVNVASNEYFKAVKPKEIKGRIINCQFKENKNGQYKAIMTFAKKARGMMCRYIVKNKIENPEDLKGFNLGGYVYHESLSTENDWVFTR